MRVVITIRGYGEVTFEGPPLEVLEEADRVITEWKVRFHGEEKGEGG